MDTEDGHLVEDADGVSVAVLDADVDGAGAASKTMEASREAAAAHGLIPRPLAEQAEQAVEVRDAVGDLVGVAGEDDAAGAACLSGSGAQLGETAMSPEPVRRSRGFGALGSSGTLMAVVPLLVEAFTR